MFHNAISDQLIELFSAHFYSALTSPTNWLDCLSLHRQLLLGRTRWEFSIIITIYGDDSASWDGDLNSRLWGASLFVRFDPISYFYPKSLTSRVEYVGWSVLATEVHVLDRARQAASTAPPCSVKSCSMIQTPEFSGGPTLPFVGTNQEDDYMWQASNM